MLGCGEFHRLVPREPGENVRYRLDLLKRAANSHTFQQGVIAACKADILFYINSFVVQYNPLQPFHNRVGPFVTWDYQEKALCGDRGILWCWENNKTAVIEKSREMGASWLFLILQDWLALFYDYSKSTNMSHRAEAVDSKDDDSLFWKLRFMHEHLPDWLKGRVVEESMRCEFKRTRSRISGQATTARFGVGGRAADLFFDEFQELPPKLAKEVREKTTFTSNRRFFNGTHLGPDTEFYQLTISSKIVKIQMHWTRHPEKNPGLYSYDTKEKKLRFWRYDGDLDGLVECPGPWKHEFVGYEFVMDGSPHGGVLPGIRSPWYDRKCDEVGSSYGIAMALDIDPKGSVSQFFDPLMIVQLKMACRPALWEGDVQFDDRGNLLDLVEVPNGPLKIWCPLQEKKPPIAPYGAGCDVAGGSGATPSCLTLTNGTTGEKVLEYVNGWIEPKDFACLCMALCNWFQGKDGSRPRITWEHRGPGINFGIKLMDLGANIASGRTEDKLGRPRNTSIGFNPEGQGKPTLLREYDSALRKRLFHNPSEAALDECLSFRHDGKGGVVHAGEVSNNPAAARDNHGDRVIADALSWKMCCEMGNLTSVVLEKQKAKAIEINTFEYRQYLDQLEEEEELVWA